MSSIPFLIVRFFTIKFLNIAQAIAKNDLIWIVIATVVLVGTQGFIFGTGNNHGILPVQERILDNSLFTKDYLVNEQVTFNIRSILIYVLTYSEKISGLDTDKIYFLYYIFTSALFVHATYLISKLLYAEAGTHKSREDKFSSVRSEKTKYILLLMLLIGSKMDSVGSSALMSEGLLPSSFSIPFALYGIYFLFKRDLYKMSCALALSIFFHVLIGLLASIVIWGALLLVMLAQSFSKRGYQKEGGAIEEENVVAVREISTTQKEYLTNLIVQIKGVILPFLLFLLLSSPSLFPLAVFPLFQESNIDSEKVGYIIGEFRNPHHYIPSYFIQSKMFWFFVAQLVAILLLIKDQIFNKYKKEFLSLLLVLNLLYGIGYLFVEVFPITSIIKLQLFRISILSIFLIKVVFALKLINLLQVKWTRYFLILPFLLFVTTKVGYIDRGWEKFMLILPIFYLLQILITNRFRYSQRVYLYSTILIVTIFSLVKAAQLAQYSKIPYESQNKDLYSWIQTNTSKDSLFITPISMYDFRYGAKRSMVISYKSFMFKDHQMLEWYNRVGDLCFEKEPECQGWNCPQYCDERYKNATEEQFLQVVTKYDADYLIMPVQTREVSLNKFTLIYEDKMYKLYQYKE